MVARPISSKKTSATFFLEFIFLLWVVAVNVFYYLQFRDLLLARFGPWINRWR